jgi:dTMP kinase
MCDIAIPHPAFKAPPFYHRSAPVELVTRELEMLGWLADSRQPCYDPESPAGEIQKVLDKDLKRRGIFITFEGVDGSGKSTQHRRLVEFLRGKGLPAVSTREPGGTPIGEKIRSILLGSSTKGLAPLAELALMYAARAQHLEEVVRPALARGEIVISDRYNDASLAYQGYGRQLGAAAVKAIDRVICGTTQPDLTLVLDLPPRQALQRATGRDRALKSASRRFEAESLEFHERVRKGYLAIARREPRRVKVIRADRRPGEIEKEIQGIVRGVLARRGRR